MPANASRKMILWLLGIFLVALVVRSLTAYFMAMHIDLSGWFPYDIYAVFDRQAKGMLDGTIPMFWITDPSQMDSAIYPPGYSYWVAFVYAITGIRSTVSVQVVQTVLDSASVLIVAGIGTAAYSLRVGIAAGFLAALSPLLAIYAASPLADAPASWIVLGGIWMLVVAVKRGSIGWAMGAGLMVGLSCWIRANGLLLTGAFAIAVVICMDRNWRKRVLAAAIVLFGTVVMVTPIVVRNSIAFGTLVPVGLGAGTNLWEGIGETSRAEEFGAVYGDRALIERERAEMGRPGDESIGLYSPDGVERDRHRMQKALSVITEHPLWYATVMTRRMVGLLKYVGSDSPIYGSTGFIVTPSKTLPPELRCVPFDLAVIVVGSMQAVSKWLALPLMMIGVWIGARLDWRMTAVIASAIFYYLVAGTFMHVEIRYTLPMQAVLFVFAGLGMVWLFDHVSGWIRHRGGRPIEV